MKITLDIEHKDHEKEVLTNLSGDTYTSKSGKLIDFLVGSHNPTSLYGGSEWVAVADALPKPLQTVFLSNGKGWTSLGCLVETNEGWHWAEGNGVVYEANGEIVSECESDDLDVSYWHPFPKPPTP